MTILSNDDSVSTVIIVDKVVIIRMMTKDDRKLGMMTRIMTNDDKNFLSSLSLCEKSQQIIHNRVNLFPGVCYD